MGAPNYTPGAAAPAGPVRLGTEPADPFELLRDWLPANDDPVRPLSTLATVDAEGLPNARTVLQSALLDDAVTIHTDAHSRKAAEIAAHPKAALVIPFPQVSRQIVLRGAIARSTPEEETLAYQRRSRYLQVLAWQNTVETAQLPEEMRQQLWGDFDAQHRTLTAPESWAGYALRPSEIIFWEGTSDAPSRRAVYQRAGSGWVILHLPG
ncbi:pyridoxamine 5'-phosphate oxidase [Microbacterium sediminicola]|uniref:Pyridoxamine 5'-phosphate oxidase n=1 Tax=Microbacterium sediminicola TaxID=415210 RepID=A0ABN2IJK7_9MICO